MLKVGVGYPDTWRDYAGLEIVAGDAFGNAERAELFEYRQNLAKLGKPVDRGEWVMTPQTVNAVNLPAMNAMNFPAAILQPPYFDPKRPLAMDYGAIGAVIGHEISHSFDDQGALFDATGRLHNWWTPEDFAHFEASSQAARRAVRRLPAVPRPGGQGPADAGREHRRRGRAGRGLRRLPAVAAAASRRRWCRGSPATSSSSSASRRAGGGKLREPALRHQILTDGHAPARVPRRHGAQPRRLVRAFDVKPGEELYLAPADRVRVW